MLDNPTGDEPAFPAATGAVFKGMSLRDYFAAQALSGLLGRRMSPPTELTYRALADHAYSAAEAMLVARVQRGEAE
jgi:hypothetical protein